MKKRILLSALLLLLLTAAAVWFWFLPKSTTTQTLEVHFLDVGQGDCAVVLCGGQSLLIDAGESNQSQFVYSYLKNTLSLTHLDYVVATHPDSDHIGGIAAALNACTAGVIYSSVTENDGKPFASMVKYAGKQGISLTVPSPGDTFALGSATVTFLGPVREYDGDNNNSLVLRIDFGETSFLFTGDAEAEAEEDMLSSGANLRATLLKVSHHGSSSSTTEEFLERVQPQYAVISVGENSYGHPADSTLSRLYDCGCLLFRTDESGTIVCTSDGKSLTFNCNAVTAQPVEANYIGNANSKKFHIPTCESVSQMKDKNKVPFATQQDAIDAGYVPCKACGGGT